MQHSNFNENYKKSKEYVCLRCKKDKKVPVKFSNENKLIPSRIPDTLKNLLISRAIPVMQIYTKSKGGQLA